MQKKISIILIVFLALLLIALVILFFNKRIQAIDRKINPAMACFIVPADTDGDKTHKPFRL